MNTVLTTLRAIALDFYTYFSPASKLGRLRLGALLVVLVGIGMYLRSGSEEIVEITEQLPLVAVGTAATIDQSAGASFIGTVESVSEARIQTEASGRIVRVNTELGARVSAGTVIAEIENAAAYAAVLQAEGAYEAALASAAVSQVSVTQATNQVAAAENAVASAVQGAYTVSSNGFYTLIDELYGNPESTLPGVRVSGSQTAYLNNERVAFQDILPAWQQMTFAPVSNENASEVVAASRSYTNRTIAVVDAFILALSDRDVATLQGKSNETWITELNALRSSLTGAVSALNAAESNLQAAEKALAQAEIASTGGDVSASDAQVKQALGALRAAQANLAKYIIRTPISGTINELSVKAGDYVGMSAPVALVANNGALLVTTYVGEADLSLLSVGQPVVINGNASGSVAAIAPGIDSVTRKTEVKIATDTTELRNGDTVTVTLPLAPTTTVMTNTPIRIPIEAVKFSGDTGSILVVDNGTLVAKPVTLGPIVGTTVTILEGIELTTAFVLDARGLVAGTKVEVSSN